MVARDGIEPPTPAFSGPRSTTELSGLGISNAISGIAKNHRAHRFPSIHVYCTSLFRGSMSPAEPATQTQTKYSNLTPLTPTHRATRYSFSYLNDKDAPCTVPLPVSLP